MKASTILYLTGSFLHLGSFIAMLIFWYKSKINGYSNPQLLLMGFLIILLMMIWADLKMILSELCLSNEMKKEALPK